MSEPGIQVAAHDAALTPCVGASAAAARPRADTREILRQILARTSRKRSLEVPAPVLGSTHQTPVVIPKYLSGSTC
jgi:hypothetical protein